MTETVKKKKNTALLFLLAFAVLVVVTLVINYKSQIVLKLRGPDTGVERLSIIENRLIVISRQNETYVWDWNNLSGWPQVGSVNAQKMTAFHADRLLWVPAGSSNVIVVSDLKGDKELKRLPLGDIKKCNLLETSANGKYAAAALELYGSSGRGIQLAVIDPNLTEVSAVVTENMEGKSKIESISVSNDGAYIAGVGAKEAGWILVAETRSKRILWEQSVKSSVELNKVIFSPDGQFVYASEPGRYIYMFETISGKPAKQFVMDKYENEAALNNPQTIGMLAASPDGRLFAATTEPSGTAWVWDVKTGKKVTMCHLGLMISGLSFSPDSSLLVTGLVVTNNIKIWKIPQGP
jgi:WD40 repeat protein